MDERRIQLGDIILTIEDIQVLLNDETVCRLRLSHKAAPEGTLAELYCEVVEGELSIVCRTPLTPRRFEILARFLYMYEKNIIRFFRESTRGMTPYMFKVPMI